MVTELLEIKAGVKYFIDIKWYNGYKSHSKYFNDERHYENWCNFIEASGGKVIGINTEASLKSSNELRTNNKTK